MSRYTIRMNFRRAREKAQNLEDTASDLENLASKQLEDTLNDLSYSWTGENSRKYLAKGQLLQEKLLASAKDLRETAHTIRRIAKEIYDAEMEALRIAESRQVNR